MQSIGEKVESIVLARASGEFGLYLGGSPQTYGAARVQGMTFKVGSCAELGPFPILHVETGVTEYAECRYEIACAVDRIMRQVKFQERQADLASGVEALKAAGYAAELQGGSIKVQDPVYTQRGGSSQKTFEPIWLDAWNIRAEVARFIDVRS